MSECEHELGQCIQDKGGGYAEYYCRLCGAQLYVWYGPLSAEGLARGELEHEVFLRLRMGRPTDTPIVKTALSMKTISELEDILRRMKEAGR